MRPASEAVERSSGGGERAPGVDGIEGPPADARPAGEASRRLAPRSRWLWRTGGALAAAPVLVAALVVPRAAGVTGPLLTWAPAVVALALAVVMVAVVPELLWRRWRYEIGRHEIEIRHGSLAIKHTLVPIARVQHVETRSGPLQRAFGLATVVFHTAAGGNEIPQLTNSEATTVSAHVAALTRTPDDV